MNYNNPLKWLLAELPAYIQPMQLDVLMTCYNINKHAYERQVKIRHAERIISGYAQRNDPRDARTIARWRAKLAQLKEQQS